MMKVKPGRENRNILDELLSPFQSVNNSFSGVRSTLDSDIEKTINLLTNKVDKYAPRLKIDRKKARDTLTQGVGDLSTSWTSLYGKYKDLMDRSLNQAYAGINDLPIGTDGARGDEYKLMRTPNQFISNSDLRAMIQASTYIIGMVEGFAMAEFMLVNNHSSSIAVNMNTITNLAAEFNGTPINSLLGHDQHNVGSVCLTYLSHVYYSAFSACLLELIDQLKATVTNGKSLFDETLIKYAGEFNRKPQKLKGGSDHAWTAHSVSLFSGSIPNFQVVGNIVDESSHAGTRSGYPGTWGEGAIIPELGNRTVNNGNLLSSLAVLLGVDSPSSNNDPIISVKSNGAIESLIGPAKIIPRVE